MNLATEVALVRLSLPLLPESGAKGGAKADELQTVVAQLLKVTSLVHADPLGAIGILLLRSRLPSTFQWALYDLPYHHNACLIALMH